MHDIVALPSWMTDLADLASIIGLGVSAIGWGFSVFAWRKVRDLERTLILGIRVDDLNKKARHELDRFGTAQRKGRARDLAEGTRTLIAALVHVRCMLVLVRPDLVHGVDSVRAKLQANSKLQLPMEKPLREAKEEVEEILLVVSNLREELVRK